VDFTHIGLITDDLLASTETIKQTIDSQMLSQEELVTVLANVITGGTRYRTRTSKKHRAR